MKFDYDEAKKNGNIFEENVFIEYGVKIGCNNYFSNNCTIRSNCIIGNNNIFGINVSIGSPSRERIKGTCIAKSVIDNPQIVIGDLNLFEDNVVIQMPLETLTEIGSNVCIGAFCHISHDAFIGNDVVTASHCSIGGYSILLNHANIGMGARIHQRTVIGAYSMIGAGSVIINHIAPFATVVGVPARYLRVNRVGLMRAGLTEVEIEKIDEWYKIKYSVQEMPADILICMKDFKQSINVWKRDRPIIPDVKSIFDYL